MLKEKWREFQNLRKKVEKEMEEEQHGFWKDRLTFDLIFCIKEDEGEKMGIQERFSNDIYRHREGI